MTLPPIGPDTYDTWQWEWGPTDFAGVPPHCSASGTGYIVAKAKTLPCVPRGAGGFDLGPTAVGDGISEAFPDCPNDPRFGAYASMSLRISMGAYQQPGSVQHADPCQHSPIVIQTYPVELTMTIREGSPSGPVAVDVDGVPRRLVISGGAVVETGGNPYMGSRPAGNPWPRYYFVIDHLFARNIYPIATINAQASIGGSAPPPPPPPQPPPPTAGPPMPACLDDTFPSTVALSGQDSGMVPLR